MINLGIIGTNWITHQFVQAALSTKKYELTAVYSRHLENEFVRLDVIEVYLKEKSYKINHIKQVM